MSLSQAIIDHAAGMDFFIGDKDLIRKGIGSQIIQTFIENKIWPQFQYCIVDPDIKNIAAIKCYEKLNFKSYTVMDSQDAIGRPARLNLTIFMDCHACFAGSQ